MTPSQINDGNCNEFAVAIEDAGFGNAIWGDEIPYNQWSNISRNKIDRIAYAHCFIEYNNRFYDSECPQGCEHPDYLPCYQRLL